MQEPIFWSLRKPDSARKRAGWNLNEMGEDIWGELPLCPKEGNLGRGGKRLKDLSVLLPGKSIEDIVWTWHSDCLLTDRALELFQSSGFTGFDTRPVRAVFKGSKESPPRLSELVITGWGGVAPPESGITLTWECPGCHRKKYSDPTNPGKIIDPTQWDGSDFFFVWPLPAFIFVTHRVANAIRQNKLTGAVLKQPKDLEFGTGGIGAGKLSAWMSEERAKKLGEPYGID